MAAELEDRRWVTKFLWGPGQRLGGGTDEVNRNIVAERALGLPGEPRDDDTLPWREVPGRSVDRPTSSAVSRLRCEVGGASARGRA
jgi:hypothetical protein